MLYFLMVILIMLTAFFLSNTILVILFIYRVFIITCPCVMNFADKTTQAHSLSPFQTLFSQNFFLVILWPFFNL